MRSLTIRLFILLGLFFPALAFAVTPMVAAATTTVVKSGNDVVGTGVAFGNNGIYYTTSWKPNSPADDGEALVGEFATPLANGATPSWMRQWPDGDSAYSTSGCLNGPYTGNGYDSFQAVDVGSDGAYFAGHSFQQTADFVGCKEGKEVVVKFNLNGAAGSADNAGAVWIAREQFYPGNNSYGGGEGFNTGRVSVENGTTYFYAAGSAQSNGCNSTQAIRKYDSSGNQIWQWQQSAGCGGSSFNAISVIGTNVYAAGGSSFDGNVPEIVVFPTAGSSQIATFKSTVDSGYSGGTYTSLTVLNGNLYAAGYLYSPTEQTSYLLDIWDTSGNRLAHRVWSSDLTKTNGQQLTGIMAIGSRLFAVGWTRDTDNPSTAHNMGGNATPVFPNSSSYHGYGDGVIFELNPSDGSLLSTTSYGENDARDQAFEGATTDGTDLYVIGAERDSSGFYHAIVLRYMLTVGPLDTTMTLTSSSDPSLFGQTGFFTAMVVAAAGTPSGTVMFTDGMTTLGTGTLDGSGQTTFASSSLSVGSHSITAVYGGDSNFTASTSAALSQTVNKAPTTTTLTSSSNPSLFGQTVLFTAAVSVISPGAGMPSGTVTFQDGSTTLCSAVALSGGSATCSTPGLAAGSHTISASYGGDGSFNGSSGLLTQTVVNQNLPPSANAGPDQILEATSPAGATVNLDGTGSTDPDGDALTYIWSGSFGLISGSNLTVTLPLGTHIVTLTVSDGQLSSSDTVRITVQETHTASGTYTWDSGAGTLTINTTATDFTCNGPTLGLLSISGIVITDSTMTWMRNGVVDTTWTRSPAGAANDIAGVWTSIESRTGNSYTFTINSDGTFSVGAVLASCGGGQNGISAYSQHWSSGYSIQFWVSDPTHQYTAISVSGPYVSTVSTSYACGSGNYCIDLVHDAGGESWSGWSNGSYINFGATYPIDTPLTYTFRDGAGNVIGTDAVEAFVVPFATHLAPAGTLSTAPIFSWDYVPGEYSYAVELHDNTGNMVWSDYNVPTGATSIAYAGPVLTEGMTYNYYIQVKDRYGNASFAPGSFVYSAYGSSYLLQVFKSGTGSGAVATYPSGIDCGAVCSVNYAAATIVSLTAALGANSTFAGWSGDADCSDGSVTMDANKTCTAIFNLVPPFNHPPLANAGPDQTLEATSPAGALVAFNGSLSSDPDGDALSFTWAGPFVTANGANPTVTLPLGTYTVILNVSDGETSATDTVLIVVRDTTPPVVTVPGNITVEASEPTGSIVTFTASASDLVDGGLVPTCTHASGSTFALGNTTVICIATDAAGNIGSASFIVTVQDTRPPVIATHADVTVEATSAAGAVVSYSSPTTTDAVDGAGVANCTPASGITFSLGNMTVICTAIDAHGNAATPTTFVVHVRDTTAPVIAAVANITVEASSAAGSVVSYISPATSDVVDGAGVANCAPTSGSTFALGDTSVTCRATDTAGNSSSITFSVTVRDTTPPVISVSQLPLANANGWNNSNVTVSFSATDAVSTPTCTVNSVTLTTDGAGQVVSTSCADAAGNSATASHIVNLDKTAPVVTATRIPAANANGWNNTDVTAHFTATDSLAGIQGAAFADVLVTGEGAGQTASYSFTDLAGNTSSATVSNISIDKTAPALTMPSLAGSYGLNSSLTLTFTSTDALSQIAAQSATLNGNMVSNGSTVVLSQLGSNTFVLSATDKAGNSVTETRQFTVNYTFGGFLSPLTADSRTTFRLSSVIPVKFDLYDANGAAVSTAIAHLSLQQISGGEPIGDPIDATPTSGADSGNLFRYSSGHYMYNLSTKPFSAGSWRIQATLDDGTVRSIDIGLTSK